MKRYLVSQTVGHVQEAVSLSVSYSTQPWGMTDSQFCK